MDVHSARRWFASDNNATVHPDIMAALAEANLGHAIAYGADSWTERARASLRAHFGEKVEPFFVFNGTGGNVLAVDALLRPHEAVVCSDWSHINTDECGAPERYVGCKLLPLASRHGKLEVADIDRLTTGEHDEHHVVPRLLSLSQATEFGTVYTAEELRSIVAIAHERGLLVHVDGARLANAAAALDVSLRALTTDCDVDVVTFGGTKNGLMFGEVVVFLKPEFSDRFLFLRKQAMQLASKMRFIAAQFEALLANDLWLRNATAANRAAARLAERVRAIPGVEVTRPVEANAVFVKLDSEVAARLQKQWPFYGWDEGASEYRWMTAWDTTTEDVEGFVRAVSGATSA